MSVNLTIPDNIFEQSRGEIARDLLERAVIEAQRSGAISTGRLAEILDLTIDEANGFLKTRNVHSELSAEDIEEGREVLMALSRQ